MNLFMSAAAAQSVPCQPGDSGSAECNDGSDEYDLGLLTDQTSYKDMHAIAENKQGCDAAGAVNE